MNTYRKKPVEILAEQITAGMIGDLVSGAVASGLASVAEDGSVIVRTLEGEMVGRPGDYLIKGLKGEFYPCRADIFEMTYDLLPGTIWLSFSEVIRGIKEGKRYARSGWNGKGMFVFLVPGSNFKVNREPLLSILGKNTEVDYHGHIDTRTGNGQIVPWTCSQTDMLAEDWMEV